MTRVLFELNAAPGLADALCARLGSERAELERRRFPDGESYLRYVTPVAGREVVLVCTLAQPDDKIASLLFAAAAARAQGATSVGLVAPYLPYLRQDMAFLPGEAVTSVTFAKLLSEHFDWLVTVDPHLHRYRELGEIYSIPAAAASATEVIADWIAVNVEQPCVIIGPDEESRQWVERIGHGLGATTTGLRKQRSGDFAVAIDGQALAGLGPGNVVLVDDIASSARTMIEAVKLVQAAVAFAPVCVVVHPIFAGDAYELLLAAGAGRVVSTNAIEHASNAIDLADTLARAILKIE
ncbi:MAG: ribose-phosphate diphosphokinase [Mycobacterium sp.]